MSEIGLSSKNETAFQYQEEYKLLLKIIRILCLTQYLNITYELSIAENNEKKMKIWNKHKKIINSILILEKKPIVGTLIKMPYIPTLNPLVCIVYNEKDDEVVFECRNQSNTTATVYGIYRSNVKDCSKELYIQSPHQNVPVDVCLCEDSKQLLGVIYKYFAAGK
eukprot:203275_1